MSGASRTWRQVLDEHARVVGELAEAGTTLDKMAAVLISALRGGRRVYVLGNGGSAADAQHIAAELLGRFKRDRVALPAMALTTDSSTLTAVGNDLGYASVFSRQVEGLVQADDIVWILSTSGNSPNVLEAARAARRKEAVVLGFAGKSGGELAALCSHVFLVPHDASDRIQEAHELAYHYLCERVEVAFI